MPTEMSLLNGRLLDSVLPPDGAASNLASPTFSDKPLTLARLHKFQFKAQIKQCSNIREQVPNRDYAKHDPSVRHADNWKWCESFTVARLPKFEHCHSSDLHDALPIPSIPDPSISRKPVNTIRARMQNRPHSLSRTSSKRTTVRTTTCNKTQVAPTRAISITQQHHHQANLPAPLMAEVARGLAFFVLCLLYAVALVVLARFLRAPLLGRLVSLVLQVSEFTLKSIRKKNFHRYFKGLYISDDYAWITGP